MPSLRTVLVDDDPGNLENLSIMLSTYCAGVNVVGVASDIPQALSIITREKPDLLFLDVELKGSTGFDLLEELGRYDFQVIIVTAYDQYAIRAFRFAAIDYLLKPVSVDELQKAVKRAWDRSSAPQSFKTLENLVANMRRDVGNPRIGLPMSTAIEFIPVHEITRCLGESSYTTFYLKNGGSKTVSRTLKEYEDMLDEHGFMRVHKSHIVNMRCVKSFVRSADPHLVMDDNSVIPVSRLNKSKVMSKLTALS
ncbi:MAG: response regulator transcription factor [Flavobacteriales bacterium]|nr:response regulator transcription factor [Flavobacteriales bacterium]